MATGQLWYNMSTGSSKYNVCLNAMSQIFKYSGNLALMLNKIIRK